MPPYKVFHQQDDEDATDREVVGTKDLRESFKDQERLRGSFSINGVMLNQFETNSIENLLAQLNDKAGQTGVKASIDDGYHLVLTGNGPSVIRIASGPVYQDVSPQAGNTADEVIQKLKAAADEHNAKRDGGPKNTILEDLGLEETTEENERFASTEAGGTPAPGPSEQERREAADKAREAKAAGTAPAEAPAIAGQTREIPTVPSAPVTGGAEDGRMTTGAGRTGQGAGYSPKPDGTPAVLGTPQGDAQRAAPSPDGVPAAPDPSPSV